MTRDTPRSVAVLGGGLAGALIAEMLGRRGLEVDVFEKRGDPRVDLPEEGRSINLAISTRGLHALAEVGLRDEALRIAIPMRGRMVHDVQGRVRFHPYGRRGECIHSISRAHLNRLLVQAADRHPGVRFHFGSRVESVQPLEARVQVRDGAGLREHSADLLIGADGAFSRLRAQMRVAQRMDFEQFFIEHGYKEFTIPPDAQGEFAMDPGGLHIWPRHDFMLIALPNPDFTFTATLFLPFRGGECSFEALDAGDEAVHAFFEAHFPDALAQMPGLCEDYRTNPTSSLVTVRCNPYHLGSRAVLVGDAAHAVVPFYGQGMNAAFEDCRILDHLLDTLPVSEALARFTAERKPDADAISELALANFFEMRSRVTSPVFHLRRQLDDRLARLLPGHWTPLYEMVTFSNRRYSEAKARAERQERLLDFAVGGAVGVGLAHLLSRVNRLRERDPEAGPAA